MPMTKQYPVDTMGIIFSKIFFFLEVGSQVVKLLIITHISRKYVSMKV